MGHRRSQRLRRCPRGRGRVVAAAGPADDRPARPGGLDPTGPWLLDAQPAPGRMAPRAHDPLVADWLLQRLDHGEQQATREDVGVALAFPHAAINGWYYLGTPPLSPRTILAALLQGRGRLLRFFRYGVLGPGRDPVVADRRLLAGLAEQWHSELLPGYQRLVHEGDQQLPTAPSEQLVS